MPQMVPVTKVVSIKVKMPTDKVQSVTSLVVRTVSTNPQFVAMIAIATQLQTVQVQTVLTALTENINEPPNKIVDIIAQKTNISKENVVMVIQAFTQSVTTNKELTASVAQKENIKAEEVTKVVEAQMPFISDPLKNIEQTVSIPPTVSLEDYEQVKSMWKEQYEKGEVPVTENIKTREAWVDQDIVTITNTLNKLLSTEDKLRQEGLDEVGYILPIFLINNIKGGELAVYLKAKLEAAKTVQEEKAKEKEIEEKVKEKVTEEFVEVAKPKVEEKEKTMEMKEEMKIDEKPEEKPNK
jgi:nucleoid DNA-binding protein